MTHRFATGTPEPTTQQEQYRAERRATERVSERDLRSFDTFLDRHWETADKLYRIIHPQQEHDERARRPVGGRHAAAPDLQPDEKFPQREQQGGHGGANPYVFPGDVDIR